MIDDGGDKCDARGIVVFNERCSDAGCGDVEGKSDGTDSCSCRYFLDDRLHDDVSLP